MKEILLEGRQLYKTFTQGKREIPVLNNVDITIYKNDFTVIMGPSGAGKSTLLYTLSGMNEVDSGEIVYDNQNIRNRNEKQMATLRSEEFGFVFQQTHLVSYLTIYENIIAAGYTNTKVDAKVIKERANQLLKSMKIEDIKEHLPSQVSGGEGQRGAIARAMINQPGILFADEPTGALNKANSEQILDLLSAVYAQGQSILMVTHDIRAAIRGTHLLYIEDGHIIGEKSMSPYVEKDAKKRELEIQTWLSSLEW